MLWYYSHKCSIINKYLQIWELKVGKSTLKVKVHFQVIIFKLIDNTIYNKILKCLQLVPTFFQEESNYKYFTCKIYRCQSCSYIPFLPSSFKFLHQPLIFQSICLMLEKASCTFQFFLKNFQNLQIKKKKLVIHMLVVSVRSTKCLGAQTNSLIIFCIQGKIQQAS